MDDENDEASSHQMRPVRFKMRQIRLRPGLQRRSH